MFILVVGTVAPTISPTLVATITEHVFKDQAMLGYSLVSVSATSVVLAILVLGFSLRYLRPEMDKVAREYDEAAAAEAKFQQADPQPTLAR
ncbi:hypothetical protein D9M71_785530 [compost metagenome]